jgi:hypothetical protein
VAGSCGHGNELIKCDNSFQQLCDCKLLKNNSVPLGHDAASSSEYVPSNGTITDQ